MGPGENGGKPQEEIPELKDSGHVFSPL